MMNNISKCYLKKNCLSVVTILFLYDFHTPLIEVIRTHLPDLVILDINLGKDIEDGVSLLNQIRSEFYDMPFIIYSAYDHYKDDLNVISADYSLKIRRLHGTNKEN